jgi:hypothetical protein
MLAAAWRATHGRSGLGPVQPRTAASGARGTGSARSPGYEKLYHRVFESRCVSQHAV